MVVDAYFETCEIKKNLSENCSEKVLQKESDCLEMLRQLQNCHIPWKLNNYLFFHSQLFYNN